MGDRYRDHPFWKNKPLTPAQILIQDIGLETLRPGKSPRLEINEVLSSTLFPVTESPFSEKLGRSSEKPPPLQHFGSTRTEQHRLVALQEDYGWMSRLRRSPTNNQYQGATCRWIHIYSQFPEYLHGVFAGLSNWSVQPEAKVANLRQLDRCIYDHERFSKHGKFFSPFLRSFPTSQNSKSDEDPVLLSLPYLDWTVYPGPTPPLRFQIDPRQGRPSSRTPSHPLRTILQHYYRLEDTTDRDRTQVYAQHQPWNGDREIDLKIRQWFGHYPTGLVVDELWVLVVDSRHIVTFSANQTWKARWPPLQLTSRISDVSFRGIRDNFLDRERTPNYTALTHAICCLHGAVGMLHRSFWPDMPVPCSDRYSGHLSRLQYRLHRSPNTKLVTDLLQIHDELNIVLQITRQQEEIISELRQYSGSNLAFMEDVHIHKNMSNGGQQNERGLSSQESLPQLLHSQTDDSYELFGPSRQISTKTTAPPRLHYAFRPPNPLDEMLDMLKREYDDLKGLRDSSNELVTRTVQLVNVRLEDHGRAVLVFTVVTIIFLPLSFISSYFGMNIQGVRESSSDRSDFWTIAALTALGTVVLSLLLAFWGGHALERFYSRRSVAFSGKQLAAR